MKERLKQLLEKLLSFKFTCLVITIVLLVTGYVNEGTFLAVLLAVIAGREGQKIAGKISGVQDTTEVGG